MSWNGFRVLYKSAYYDSAETDGRRREREELDHIHFDQMFFADTAQDYFLVLSGIDAMVIELHKELPHIKNIVLQPDNARFY